MKASEKHAQIQAARNDLFHQEVQLREDIRKIVNEELGGAYDSLISLGHAHQGKVMGTSRITVFLSTGPEPQSPEEWSQKIKRIEERTGFQVVEGK